MTFNLTGANLVISWVVAFVLGCGAEYLSDQWTIRWNNATRKPYPFPKEDMKRKVQRARKLGIGLLVLGAIDVAGVFGGVGTYIAVNAGACVGSWIATGKYMWGGWHKRNKDLGKEDPDDD